MGSKNEYLSPITTPLILISQFLRLLMAFMLHLWILMSMGLIVTFNMQPVFGAPQVPCYFSFGDSLVDNGNNNNLSTIAKANYPPYGIDFPEGPTGRFTNGRNIADFIAQLLGFADFIPPFATARGQNILKGVNYGSGGAGIRDETSTHLGAIISFNRQLLNHGKTVSRIGNLLGNQSLAKKYLSKCLYTVVIGTNDYINNYLLPQFYPTSKKYTPDQYGAVLIQQYSLQLKALYNYGARKIALFGAPAIGCMPVEINMAMSTTCVDSINAAVELFNNRLRPLVDELNAKLVGSKFIYLNTSGIQPRDRTNNGIQIFNQPCCQVAPALCAPGSVPCSDRTQYAYYDLIHPTEVVYAEVSKRAYASELPTDAYPTDICHLAPQ